MIILLILWCRQPGSGRVMDELGRPPISALVPYFCCSSLIRPNSMARIGQESASDYRLLPQIQTGITLGHHADCRIKLRCFIRQASRYSNGSPHTYRDPPAPLRLPAYASRLSGNDRRTGSSQWLPGNGECQRRGRGIFPASISYISAEITPDFEIVLILHATTQVLHPMQGGDIYIKIQLWLSMSVPLYPIIRCGRRAHRQLIVHRAIFSILHSIVFPPGGAQSGRHLNGQVLSAQSHINPRWFSSRY